MATPTYTFQELSDPCENPCLRLLGSTTARHRNSHSKAPLSNVLACRTSCKFRLCSNNLFVDVTGFRNSGTFHQQRSDVHRLHCSVVADRGHEQPVFVRLAVPLTFVIFPGSQALACLCHNAPLFASCSICHQQRDPCERTRDSRTLCFFTQLCWSATMRTCCNAAPRS